MIHALLEGSPDFLFFKDRRSRFVLANRAHCQACLGVDDPRKVVGLTDFDIFPREDAQRFFDEEQSIMDSKRPVIGREWSIPGPSGRTKWLTEHKLPIVDAAGVVRGLIGIGRDVTALHETQAALMHERDLLHTLMDSIPDPIFFKDSDGLYTRINKAHAQVLGLASPEDAIGHGDAGYHPAEDYERLATDERILVQQGRALLDQVEHDARRDRWYLTTRVPIRDAAGRVSGLVGLSRDITERRKAEECLRADLDRFRAFVETVAEGDLTLRAREGTSTLGVIAQLVNQMLAGFAGILSEVRDASSSVAAFSSQILLSATEIEKAAQYGSDQVHQTTSAVEEMAASMQQVAGNARESAEAAQRVLEHLAGSTRAVDAAVKHMHEIDSAVSDTADKMLSLGERSGEVCQIIDMIDEVASRSELLALNASIEAAHAGEAGKGFSVVADEIRRLAEASAESTKRVTLILKAMESETRVVQAAMERSTAEVKHGLRLSAEARENLGEISTLVERATDLASEISNATREQTNATQTVSEAMQAMVSVNEESTAAAHETNRTVRDLVSLSEKLTMAVGRFKIQSAATATEEAGAVQRFGAGLRELAATLAEIKQALVAEGRPAAEGTARAMDAVSSRLEDLISSVVASENPSL